MFPESFKLKPFVKFIKCIKDEEAVLLVVNQQGEGDITLVEVNGNGSRYIDPLLSLGFLLVVTMVTYPISPPTYLPAVGTQATHMCSHATGFAPERTGAAPGTHLTLFRYRTVKRWRRHQCCCGCK